MVFRTYCLF